MLLLQLTDAGLDAIVAAEAAGTASVVIAELGLTATAFDQAPTLTALPGEFKRIATTSGEVAAPNMIHLVAYDTSADAYDVTGMGLFLADGTLFATYTGADVAISKSALAFGLITFDIAFSTDVGASIAFTGAMFNNPPATTEMRGVVELATLAEAAAGIDALRALTPQGAKAAVLGWLLTLDGSGSGLDADLVDGHHAADFLLAAAYIAADVKTKLLTVDGSGSGLDADLLDGQDSTYFTNIVARLGFTPLNVTAYTAADVIAKLVTVDGSGSGLDADLLDGLDSAQFVRSNLSSLVRAAGDLNPASGTVTSGVNVSSVTWSSSRVTVAYTNPVANPVPVVMGGDSGNGSSSQSAFWGSGSSLSTTGFSANFGVSGGGGSISRATFITIGG